MLQMLRRLRAKYIVYRHRKYVLNAVSRGLVLGNNVTIMENVSFDHPHQSLISIGDNTTIAPDVIFIAHDASTFKRLGVSRLGFVSIGADCFIGRRSLILPGVTVGDNTIIGAGSVLCKSVPAGVIAAGNPVRVIGTTKDFFEKHKKNINIVEPYDYENFYSNLYQNIKMIRIKNNNNIFYTKGQVKNIRSAYRFNFHE